MTAPASGRAVSMRALLAQRGVGARTAGAQRDNDTLSRRYRHNEEGRMAVLLREAIGSSLRRARTARRRTLREVSRRARVSLGYLSEVERGRKEPSSELLAAICEALDVALPDLLTEAARALAAAMERPAADVRPVGLRYMDLRLADSSAPLSAPMPVALPLAPAGPDRPAVPVVSVRAAA